MLAGADAWPATPTRHTRPPRVGVACHRASTATHRRGDECSALADRRPACRSRSSAVDELTLIQGIARSLGHNFALLAGAQDVVIGGADVGIARAGLLPQVDRRRRGTRIDERSRRDGDGRQPRIRVASMAVHQTIYSDKRSPRTDTTLLEAARAQEQEARVSTRFCRPRSLSRPLRRRRSKWTAEPDAHRIELSARGSRRTRVGTGRRSTAGRPRARTPGNVVSAEATSNQAGSN